MLPGVQSGGSILEQVEDKILIPIFPISVILKRIKFKIFVTSLALHVAGTHKLNLRTIAVTFKSIFILYIQCRPRISVSCFFSLIAKHSSYIPRSTILPSRIPEGIFEAASTTKRKVFLKFPKNLKPNFYYKK